MSSGIAVLVLLAVCLGGGVVMGWRHEGVALVMIWAMVALLSGGALFGLVLRSVVNGS